jgi:hypothetical protein
MGLFSYRIGKHGKVTGEQRGGGKPPFPTGEHEGVELRPRNALQLTGQEGRLAPALS